MKSFILSILAVVALIFERGRRAPLYTVNSESPTGTHEMGIATKLADTDFPSRYLLLQAGSDGDHVAICDASHPAVGLTDDQPASGEPLNVIWPTASKGTRKFVAAAALAAEVDIYQAAGGQVQGEPVGAGIYYKVGRTKAPAAQSTDGNYYVEATFNGPEKVVVVAALTSINTANAVDLPTTEALANALKADLIALHTAMATPARLKLL